MLYLKSADGDLLIIVLETANLEELQKGRPAHTPDGSVLIAWTPDPEWLARQIIASGGDVKQICLAIDLASQRPQTELRPAHPLQEFHLEGE